MQCGNTVACSESDSSYIQPAHLQFVALTVSSSLFTRRVLQNVTIAMVTMGTVDSDCSQK